MVGEEHDGCKHERLGVEKARTYHVPLKILNESITCKTQTTALLSDLSLSFPFSFSPFSVPMALCPALLHQMFLIFILHHGFVACLQTQRFKTWNA